MINLFDNYSQESIDLHQSLQLSGYTHPTVVIDENGFLPDDVTSPFAYYASIYKGEGEPLYFNQVKCPDFWEIRGNNSEAVIYEDNNKKASIVYVPNMTNKRYVQRVEWLDLDGKVRIVDHYSKLGIKFARTSYNLNKQPTMTTYYNNDHYEVIVENHMTKDIILNIHEQIHLFKSRVEFVNFYLNKVFGNIDRILYNSLSIPFFVSYKLSKPGDDILFWQESLPNDFKLPGNMITLLRNPNRTKKVIFQNKSDYQNIQLKYPDLINKISYLGFIYPIRNINREKLDVLILTNSDSIEAISTIIESLPKINFHIAALTEMSSKLMELSNYHNVVLYPNIKEGDASHLFEKCSFYLDINHGIEIKYAVRQAYLNGMLVLTFKNTIHNKKFISPEHIFDQKNSVELINVIKECLDSHSYLLSELKKQQKYVNQSSSMDYQNGIG